MQKERLQSSETEFSFSVLLYFFMFRRLKVLFQCKLRINGYVTFLFYSLNLDHYQVLSKYIFLNKWFYFCTMTDENVRNRFLGRSRPCNTNHQISLLNINNLWRLGWRKLKPPPVTFHFLFSWSAADLQLQVFFLFFFFGALSFSRFTFQLLK